MTQLKQPKTGRPVVPDGYGIPEHQDNLLLWSYVQKRMAEARNYWVCTVRPDGRPHCTPVWGVWLEDTLYIEGSRETRRAQNLLAHPAVSVHLESAEQVVSLEGTGVEIPKPDPQLGQRLSAAYSSKYGPGDNYTPAPDQWDHGGLFAIKPKTVLAWTRFPTDTTRFEF